LIDCDDRVEKVGDGRAAKGEDGAAGFMVNIFWLGAALRISDMTESLGPETVTDWSLGARCPQKVEEYNAIWLTHDTTHTTMWPRRTPSQSEIGPVEDLLTTSLHFDLIEMIRTSDTTSAVKERATPVPTSALRA
jgi:hypothetical protein